MLPQDVAHFNAVSRDLNSMVPSVRNRVACPLCLNLFTLEDFEAGRLTRGHSMPKAMGHWRHTLVCRTCNNRTSRNEAHLKRYGIAKWNLPATDKERFPVEAFGGRYRGTLRPERNVETGRIERTLEMKPEPGNAQPGQTMQLAMKIESELRRRRNAGLSYSPRDVMSVRIHYDIARVRSALLGAAYLDAFMHLGYGLVLNSNLDAIRSEVLEPSSGAISDVACIGIFGDHQTVFIAGAPAELICVGVSYFDLCIVLPAAADRTLAIYERLQQQRGRAETFRTIPFSEFQVVSDRWYPHGRYSVSPLGQQRCVTQPDLRTIRRIDATADASLPVLSDAPHWARRA